jgi:hypothetical protein
MRGSWAGPNIRDYGNIGPHQGAAGEFWHYFGHLPDAAPKPYRDFVHLITSAYRPPSAVVALARKEFPRPVELLASKPSYDGWTRPGGEPRPLHFETTFIGHHTQMGSLPNGHQDPPGMNLNGFRLLAENSRRGADTLIVFTSLDYNHSHASATAGGDQLAQYRGNLIWLNARPDTSFYLFHPKSAVLHEDRAAGRLFLQLERTWLAFHLIQSTHTGLHAAATARACGPGREKDSPPRFPDDQVLELRGSGAGPCGFAIEIGEPETHGDFAAFQQSVRASSRLDVSRLADGEVHLTAATGQRVGLRLATQGLPTVFRQGREHDWKSHWALWGGDTNSPVRLGWKEGHLRVQAGGHAFTAQAPGPGPGPGPASR